ncbi:MAG: hypothetical protein AAF330_05280 [Pseudomonadota bacterium]
MKSIIASLGIALAFPTISSANASDVWMCIHEHVPVVVAADRERIKSKMLDVEITNGLSFEVTKLAVDFTLFATGVKILEQNIVFPFPSPLQPGETRSETTYFTLPDAQANAFAAAADFGANAAVANALDIHEKRLVVREDIGPSFEVFWPFQPKSSERCQ